MPSQRGKQYAVFLSSALCFDPIGVFQRLVEKGRPYTDIEDEGISAIISAMRKAKARCSCRFVAVREGDYAILYEACSESIGCDHRVEVVVETDDADELYSLLPTLAEDDCHYVSCLAREASRGHDWDRLFASRYSKAKVARWILDESDSERKGYLCVALGGREERPAEEDYVRVEHVFGGGEDNATRAMVREACAECGVWLSVDDSAVTFEVPISQVEHFKEEMGKIPT